MCKFDYFVPPKEITVCQHIEQFAAQADDPKSGQKCGLILDQEWGVQIGGIDIPVLATPVTFRGPHSFCQLRLSEPDQQLSIILRKKNAEKAVIRGIGYKEEVHFQDGICSFDYEGSGQLTVQADDSSLKPLSIFISPPEEDVPDKKDPNVIWFGPGLHRIDRLLLKNGQTVYLENGAILQAEPPKEAEPALVEADWANTKEYSDWIYAENADNLTIRGMGILDTTQLPWHARRTIVFSECKNVKISGITTVGSAHWTIMPRYCRNVEISDVKVFGYRENSDAIDLVNCTKSYVHHCFLRTGDDAICLKGMLPPEVLGAEDILVSHCTTWTEKARSFGVIGETRGDFRRITYENCLSLHGYANWTHELGTLCVILSDGGTVEDLTFREIEIVQEDSWVINCRIFPDMWSTDHYPGRIQNIRFEKICIPQNARINLEGFDKEHFIKNVTVQQISAYDEDTAFTIHKNSYVESICFV